MPATGAIIQSVSQTKGAIGYVGMAYLNKEVKALKVSYDGKTYIAPSFENAKTKPIGCSAFVLYYEKKSAAKVTLSLIMFYPPPDKNRCRSRVYPRK